MTSRIVSFGLAATGKRMLVKRHHCPCHNGCTRIAFRRNGCMGAWSWWSWKISRLELERQRHDGNARQKRTRPSFTASKTADMESTTTGTKWACGNAVVAARIFGVNGRPAVVDTAEVKRGRFLPGHALPGRMVSSHGIPKTVSRGRASYRQVGCGNFYAIIHAFHCIENE
jgi:hypothetical protein